MSTHELTELGDRYRSAAGGRGPVALLRPARVRTEDGQEVFAWFIYDPTFAGITVIAARSLLGHKARVVGLGPDGGDLGAWDVRVLWAIRLADDLFEHGAALLEPGAKGGSSS